jgi:hypothetical protein
MTVNRWQRMLPGSVPATRARPVVAKSVSKPVVSPMRGPFKGQRDDAQARVFAVTGRDHPVMRVRVEGNANVLEFQEWLLSAMNDKWNIEQSIARNAAAFTGDKS